MHPYIWLTQTFWPWAQIHWIWDIVIVVVFYFAIMLLGDVADEFGDVVFGVFEGILEFFFNNDDSVVGFAKLFFVAVIGLLIYYVWTHR